MLTDVLAGEGVDVVVHRGGRTGAIVLLLDGTGERTMLTDRGACTSLAEPSRTWLEGLDLLHVPLYSLVGEPLATTTRTVVAWAREQGVQVSIDASSAGVIEERGVEATLVELTRLEAQALVPLAPQPRPRPHLPDDLPTQRRRHLPPTDVGRRPQHWLTASAASGRARA